MNNKTFYFAPSAQVLLLVASRQQALLHLNCITSINLFTATFLIMDSPLYKRLIHSGFDVNQINELAVEILKENLPICRYQQANSILSIGDKKIPVSEEVFNIFVEAEKIGGIYYSKENIGYNEILAAISECLPNMYENFLIKSNLYPTSTKVKDNISICVPSDLSGCLTILNSKFSPDEKDCCILGRDNETKSLTRILAKDTKRNAVLVGEPGVGKTAIVEKFTWQIVTNNCPEKFKNYTVIVLDVNSIIAGTEYRGSAEKRFKCLIDFLDSTPKCILFVDEIHTLLGAGACREGDLDLANALKPILARNSTQVIGATTSDEYKKYFSKDGALKRRFETILVKEPKIHEVRPMIQNQIKRLSKSHNVTISDEIVNMVIFYASCFNKETKNPDRSLDLIDRTMATAELAGKTQVTREDVLDNFDINYKVFENTRDNIKEGLAYHEAGHYIVHRFSDELYDSKTTALSIMPAENYYGAHVFEYDDTIMSSRTLTYYKQLIGSKLAGRIAERMFSDNLSAGAAQDLKNATELATNAVTKYGLISSFQNRVYYTNNIYREKAKEIDAAIDNLLLEAQSYAKEVLTQHRKDLDLLVKTLLEKKMMSGEELDELFKH